jgi:phospholipid-binding lipoprotein MlaA
VALVRSALDRLATAACFGALALAVTACSTFSHATAPDAAQIAGPSPVVEAAVPTIGPPRTVEAALPATDEVPDPTAGSPDADRAADGIAPQPDPPPETAALEEGMAQARDVDSDAEAEEYDPWERWNEPVFEFNRRLDKYVLKPVAKGYNFVVPDEIQIMISNGFDNIAFVPRLVNSLLQGKVKGAGRELGRFLINSTAGVGGLFDPAKDVFGILKSREDFGQTLGVWGVGPGPYLIVPFLEPLTVRDGVGKAVDSAMDPLSYFLPLIWDRLAMKIGDIVNERSLNLDLFQGFEESVIDMYSAVRHAYLQRRLRLIRE